jgi:phosphate transport system substrate-binding protein
MKILRLVALGITLITLNAFSQQTIQVQGPDTLILLGQKLNQLYQRQQPQVAIKVHGGNMRGAVPLLLKGEVDIVQSRGALPPEASRPDVLGVPIGAEGIVIYVNEANPVNELTVAQVRSIYTGEIVNWKQLGGPDQRILLYGGESTSGVEQYFLDAVLRGSEPFGYEGKTSTKELLEVVAAHPSGIGFASVGSAPHVKALHIRATSGSVAVEPSIANIRSLKYPISRYLYWYFARRPEGTLRDFCGWVFSSQGQLVVEGVGFQPLAPEDRLAGLRKLGVTGDVAQPVGMVR